MYRHKNRAISYMAAVLISSVLGSGSVFGQVAIPGAVESQPLAVDAFAFGMLDEASGALPDTLWQGSDPHSIEFLLDMAPSRPATPSLGSALKRVLLSPGDAPLGAGPSLGGKKIFALASAGYLEQARTVASLSSGARDNIWTQRAFVLDDLLVGEWGSACRRSSNLSSGRDDPFWIKLRVACYANAGERDAADLTLGVLREQGNLSEEEDVLLNAVALGAEIKTPIYVKSPLQYALTRKLELPLSPDLIKDADGSVLASISEDVAIDAATRISAAQKSVTLGIISPEILAAMFESIPFDVAEIGSIGSLAPLNVGDPLTDAKLYQSIQVLGAPEFIRDKAQRIALALNAANTFDRSFSLSLLYGVEIDALEGVILSPDESASFALARMAAGDGVGAGRWLLAMIGVNQSVAALPEEQAMKFIDLVNLLALLDPQTASQVARSASIALLDTNSVSREANQPTEADPQRAALILESAFDAAFGNKTGQAGLAALAASTGDFSGTPKQVVISQSLRAGGMPELSRQYIFESVWASTFSRPDIPGDLLQTVGEPDDGGLQPRLKPGQD